MIILLKMLLKLLKLLLFFRRCILISLINSILSCLFVIFICFTLHIHEVIHGVFCTLNEIVFQLYPSLTLTDIRLVLVPFSIIIVWGITKIISEHNNFYVHL